MSCDRVSFHQYATEYDPIKIGSIDGTDTQPHDRGVVRALRARYEPDRRVAGNPRHTLFVGRLNPRTTQDTVSSEFFKFGKIIRCRLVKDIVTGKSKQYAFVEFESTSAADKAYREMHKEVVEGAEVVVEVAAARRLAGWRPRRLGGGLGGRRAAGQLRFGGRDRPFRRPLPAPSQALPAPHSDHFPTVDH